MSKVDYTLEHFAIARDMYFGGMTCRANIDRELENAADDYMSRTCGADRAERVHQHQTDYASLLLERAPKHDDDADAIADRLIVLLSEGSLDNMRELVRAALKWDAEKLLNRFRRHLNTAVQQEAQSVAEKAVENGE